MVKSFDRDYFNWIIPCGLATGFLSTSFPRKWESRKAILDSCLRRNDKIGGLILPIQ